jgi:hypothetical protein
LGPAARTLVTTPPLSTGVFYLLLSTLKLSSEHLIVVWFYFI